MKAILKVNKGSAYSHLNHHTFIVEEILSSIVCLNIDGIKTDFSFKEVLIADLQEELQKAYDNFNWGSDTQIYFQLKKFIKANKIEVKEPKYNCPA